MLQLVAPLRHTIPAVVPDVSAPREGRVEGRRDPRHAAVAFLAPRPLLPHAGRVQPDARDAPTVRIRVPGPRSLGTERLAGRPPLGHIRGARACPVRAASLTSRHHPRGDDDVSREDDLALLREYTKSESLIRHMLAVEAAMRAYAERLGEDVAKWGTVGLLHDFDYERWPDPPDHPLKGAEILRDRGYPEDVIYAIKSHADYLPDCPRLSAMDKALYACDELGGFITACALVRPGRLEGLKAKSVRKKLKTATFAAAINRDDVTRGAEDFGVDLNEHIDFCIAAMQTIAAELGLESTK